MKILLVTFLVVVNCQHFGGFYRSLEDKDFGCDLECFTRANTDWKEKNLIMMVNNLGGTRFGAPTGIAKPVEKPNQMVPRAWDHRQLIKSNDLKDLPKNQPQVQPKNQPKEEPKIQTSGSIKPTRRTNRFRNFQKRMFIRHHTARKLALRT